MSLIFLQNKLRNYPLDLRHRLKKETSEKHQAQQKSYRINDNFNQTHRFSIVKIYEPLELITNENLF